MSFSKKVVPNESKKLRFAEMSVSRAVVVFQYVSATYVVGYCVEIVKRCIESEVVHELRAP